MFKTAIFSVAALALGAHSAGFWGEEDTKKSFISRVTLEEQCDLEASSFAVENLSTGEVRPFKYGEAFIRAKKSDWLKVVLNTDFTGVYFDGEKIRAGKQVKIVQSCSSETTLDNIFDSFNDTFSNK
jgi:hypothetical protein